MSSVTYYSTCPFAYIAECRSAFETAFTVEDSIFHPSVSLRCLSKKELHPILDYVGYKIFRALRLRRKYHLKKVTPLDYLPHYFEADQMAASLIKAYPQDDMKSTNTNMHDMLERFLKVDSLLKNA
jgi:hypothetical protein